MNNLYKILVVTLIIQFSIGQDPNDDIVVSKSDLTQIAESLINVGDFDNAIAIYQEILDYQINTLGLNDLEVARSSELIGELLVQTYRLDEAEAYFRQALHVKSQRIYEQQIAIRPSLELMRDLYENLGDTLKVSFLDKNLEILYKAESINVDSTAWSPFTYGLDLLSVNEEKNIKSDVSFQAMNLMEISSSYVNAGLYYDAANSLVEAISLDSTISLEYLFNYIEKHIEFMPDILNALMNYTSEVDKKNREKLLISTIYYYQSEYELAYKYIQEYVDIYTSDLRSYQLMGDYHYFNKDYISALFNYRQSQLFEPENLYSLYNQARCLYFLERYDEASLILSDVLSSDPYNFDAYYFSGLSNMQREKHKKAIDDFTDYILLNPDNEEIYYYLGISYYNIEKYNRAKESLERYLKYNNENGEAHYYLGIINENIVELETAIYHYAQARKYNPKLIDSNRRLGLLHYKNKNYGRAMEPLRDYIIFNPDSTQILEVFADILFQEQRYPESIDAFQRLYTADSTKVDYLFRVANSYIAMDDMVNAKESLTKYILLGKVDSEILFTLANIESELGDYSNAILHYQMAINLGKPSVNMYYNLAMSYAEIGNYEKALNSFESASELDPSDFEIVYQIGICYKELEAYPDAIDYFSIFTGQNPDDYLAHYILAEIYFLNSNYQLAQSHFQKSLSLNPNDSVSLYYLGMCNQKLNNFINAAKLFKKSIKINPQFASAHFELALTYNKLGKTREVKKELNILRMLDQDLYADLVEELEKN
tara:strand:+ start:2138 stop:4447 length:2310 start_codon:yes stop_codon:yes gene_type:complete